MLEADHLTVRAGDKELLDDVELVLERGEHVAIVGPNGSGKTTLLRAVLDENEPVTGTIRIGHGVVPAYFSQHDQELPEERDGAGGGAARHRAPAPAGPEAARQVPVLGLGDARETGVGALRR